MGMQEVNKILEQYHNDPADIIAILQDVQRQYRYLPEEVLSKISDGLDIPLSRIYHLATFFRAFSLDKRGEHVINVCMGTACHVRGSPRILDALERGLKLKAGATTPDLSCTLETVNCVGACALGPVVVVDEKAMGKMNPQKSERMLKQLGLGPAAGEPPAETRAPQKAVPDKTPAAAARPVPGNGGRPKAVKKVPKVSKPAKQPLAKAGIGRKTAKPTGAARPAAGQGKAKARPARKPVAAGKAAGKPGGVRKAAKTPGAVKRAGSAVKTTRSVARPIKSGKKTAPPAKPATTGGKPSARKSLQARAAARKARGSGKARK
jgi:NADH-quinone oxidoreductase subunit E